MDIHQGNENKKGYEKKQNGNKPKVNYNLVRLRYKWVNNNTNQIISL